MRRLIQLGILLVAVLAVRGETIDRIAVTVDKIVITSSDINNHLRVAAFLDARPLDLSPDARKRAARQLVEQVLVRREMEISGYPAPASKEIEPLLRKIRRERKLDDKAYAAALRDYGIGDADVRESLLLQLTVLRFIEYRFRPGVAVSDKEVERYYRETYLPRWEARNDASAPKPELDDVRDRIEQVLIEKSVNRALDAWLKRTAAEANIRYRKGAFE